MTRPTPIVHVVDDDNSFRTAVSRLLRAAGYEVRAYSSAGDFLLSWQADTPGCVVLDVRMPGPSGLDLQDAVGKHPHALPIIFLTGHGDIPMSVRTMKKGAVDFLTKPVQRKPLLDAVDRALARDAQNRAAGVAQSALRARFDSLSPRERCVFALVVAGRLNKEIAGELGISERTVKSHRAEVMLKMQVTTLADLVRVAEQLQASIPSP